MSSQPDAKLRRSPTRKRTRIKDDPDMVPSEVSSAPDLGGSTRRLAAKMKDDDTEQKKARRKVNVKVKPENVVSRTVMLEKSTKLGCKTGRPTYEECRYVVEELGKLHSDIVEECRSRNNASLGGSCGTQKCLIDGLVSTILSQNTTNANSTRAFQQLKEAFPTWQMVEQLPDPPTQLEQAIRCGGLAKIKSQRIRTILMTLAKERGSPPSLEYLRHLSNEQVKQELQRFPGLGPKTISCLLLFTMQRAEFPVDTHVHRIAKNQLKWIASNATREDAYEQLNASVPDEFKLELHCLLIAHGRQCHRCAARGKPQFPPKDGTKLPCPLVDVVKKVAYCSERGTA